MRFRDLFGWYWHLESYVGPWIAPVVVGAGIGTMLYTGWHIGMGIQ